MSSTMTAADWAALAAAGQAGGSSYLEQLNAQKQGELANIPDAGATTLASGGVPAGSTAAGIGLDAITAVQTDFPELAWLLTVPDLAPLIVSWAQQSFTDAQATAAFEGTGWYQTHAQSVRNWLTMVQTDPATAASDMAAQQSTLNATLAQMGLNATPQQLEMLSQASLAQGWNDQQTKDAIRGGITANADGTFTFTYGGISNSGSGTGSLLESQQAIQAEAAKYLVPVSQSTINAMALSMAGGTMDSAAVTAYFQQQASSLFPSIAGAIQQGITPADYVTPYKEVAAQLLGTNPSSIDMTKPQYARALTAPGPGGVPTAMSLYDWQQTLMQDPQYGYMNSVNAKDRASSIASGLAQVFGRSPTGPSGATTFNDAGAPSISGVPIN